jgi:hypothetical protein
MDDFRGPSGAHFDNVFVVCSLLVLGPEYQFLPSRRFCVTETPENRNAWMKTAEKRLYDRVTPTTDGGQPLVAWCGG